MKLIVNPYDSSLDFVENKVYGRRLVAYNSTTSFVCPLTPTPATYTNVSVSEPNFNISNGVIHFTENCIFNSTFHVTLESVSTTTQFYTDAEVSTDGITWARGNFSLRSDTVRNTDNVSTRSFGFSGGFLKGTYIRFILWGSSTNISLKTITNNGSSAPAIRLTYSCVPCIFLT